MDWIFIPLAFAVLLLLYGLRRSKKFQSEIGEEKWAAEEQELEDGVKEVELVPQTGDSPTDFVFIKFKGHVLSMRRWEKSTYWDEMSTSERKEHLAAVKKAVQKGDVVRYKMDEDIWVYYPKSVDLKKAREDFKAFKALGGQVIEEQ